MAEEVEEVVEEEEKVRTNGVQRARNKNAGVNSVLTLGS